MSIRNAYGSSTIFVDVDILQPSPTRDKIKIAPAFNQIQDLDVEMILRGGMVSKTYDGVAHWMSHGLAGSGLASFNAIRCVLSKEQEGIREADLLRALMAQELVQDITSICDRWTTTAELEVEEIYALPLFSHFLQSTAFKRGYPNSEWFKHCLENLKGFGIHNSNGIIFSQVSDVVCVLRIHVQNYDGASASDVWVVFDPQPREPVHPDGIAFSFFGTIRGAIEHLTELFGNEPTPPTPVIRSPTRPLPLLPPPCSAHMFTSIDTETLAQNAMNTIFDASMTVLQVKSELEDLRMTFNDLQDSQAWLEKKYKDLEEKCEKLEKELEEAKNAVRKDQDLDNDKRRRKTVRKTPKSVQDSEDEEVGLLPWTSGKKRIVHSSPDDQDSDDQSDGWWGGGMNKKNVLPGALDDDQSPEDDNDGRRSGGKKNEQTATSDQASEDNDDGWWSSGKTKTSLTDMNQDTEDGWWASVEIDEKSKGKEKHGSNSSTSSAGASITKGKEKAKADPPAPIFVSVPPTKSPRPSNRRVMFDLGTQPMASSSKSLPRHDPDTRQNHSQDPLPFRKPNREATIDINIHEDDIELAHQQAILRRDRERRDAEFALSLQYEFDNEENMLIQREQEKLAEELAFQQIFDCSICMETHPEDSVAMIEFCGHKFCRPCIREYISSKIQERAYPILCPLCTTEKDKTPGVINGDFLEIIGIDESDYDKYDQLELSKFSIPLECRKCGNTTNVDKEDHKTVKIITCPVPSCNGMWCRECSQFVDDEDEAKHSCDGSKELDALLATRQWKRCPACGTPIERIAGCDHMVCGVNTCKAHFRWQDGVRTCETRCIH